MTRIAANDKQLDVAVTKSGRCSAEEAARLKGIQAYYGAALVMQQARKACRDERFEEARALYDIVLSLGPVAVKALDD